MGTTPISLGIDWKNITPLPTVLPAGEYLFAVLGAQEKNGRLNVSAAVSDGEFAGKKLTFSYPDFYGDYADWARTDFRRLQIALAEDPLDGESPVNYVSRVVGHKFRARVKEDNSWTPAGEDKPRVQAKLVLSSVVAAFS